jgi:putative heme-binding domain-containing protein
MAIKAQNWFGMVADAICRRKISIFQTFQMLRFVTIVSVTLVFSPTASVADDVAVLRRDNVVAWCIVPFDAAKRGPAERATMLKELGISRCAYDWRQEHVPTFEQEILEYKKNGIEYFAFWSVHEDAFKLFEKYDLHPQIWQMMGQPEGETQQAKVEAAVQQMLPLAKRTKGMGCKLGLYNHGGWSGEPANMVAVCQRLRELGQDHVGIVYNFHHGHGHIDDWANSFAAMKPFLHCLNLNGMNAKEQPKILGIGKGDHELEMIRTVVESGYDGPIGILDHREQLDARESLLENRNGLESVRKEIQMPGSGGPKPMAPANLKSGTVSGHVYPGAEAYRHPPITVEIRASIQRCDRYNILVASDTKQSADHWELFSMNGSGTLTAYLPGMQPDHVHSDAMICDGNKHVLAIIYEPTRVRLFVDNKPVADQAITRREGGTSVPGEFAIGQLVEQTLGFSGTIDWVRVSKGVTDFSTVHPASEARDEATIGLWTYDDAESQRGTEQQDSQSRVLPEIPYDANLVAKLVAESSEHGDAIRGAAVFSDVKVACVSCHKIGQTGGTVGPDLSAVAKDRRLEQIVESVFWPKRDVKPEFINWQILTVEGRVFTGYKHASDDKQVTLRDPATGKLTSIDREDIDEEIAGSTVMPAGLTAAMTHRQQLDLIRFLSDLGRDGKPLSDDLQQAIVHSQMHGPAEFPLTKEPLAPRHWENATHSVNRDRFYDFYTKQAEFFRQQHHVPMLLGQFPGLDGGKQGHWGNQNEAVWADNRWNDAELGAAQAGVFHANGMTVARAVCVRLGDHGELSACFNPDKLSYDAVWSGGFVDFDSVRHGFVSGLRMVGTLLPEVRTLPPDQQPWKYHGFYRHGNRVVFAYQIGDVEYLDSPWVTDDGKFVRQMAPAGEHPLRKLTTGGPAQWPQIVDSEVIPGDGRPYAIDTIELPYDNPWKAPLFCGDHDFLPDGSALVCTIQGDVWHVTGLDTGTATNGTATTGVVHWRRFASGLHHALGLVVSDGQVYVQCRDQLTRLTDLNDDGEADFYECFSNAFVTSPAGHDFICGLQRDSQGNFYTASGNQGLVRISPDGETAVVIATGFRNPDGLGIMPDGTVTVPASEGEWTQGSMIHAVRRAMMQTPDDAPHFGYRGPKNGKPPELPFVCLPRGLDNSAGGQVYVDSDAFGPLKGQILHFSFGAGTWFAILRDEVDGQLQGAVIPMLGDFLSGVHRGRFNPIDGQLYVSGMSGWGSYTPDDGCFQRVRYTGDSVQMPVGFHIHENGVRVTFSHPIDAAVAADAHRQFAQCWNYRYSGAYGSPEFSTTHPGVTGHDPLAISSAHVLADGYSVFLEIPELQPVNQLHLRMHVNEDDTQTCSPAGTGHDLFATVHKLDRPFEDFPGYEARDKTIAAHPLLTDLALNAVQVLNPWRRKIQGSRVIEIETGKNLSYATREFTVKASERLAFTLSNPDVVPHNWVLVQPDALQVVGQLGNQMIVSPEAFARQYIPKSDKIIVHTDIVSPGDKQTIYFPAPAKPGRYPFLCTFPGHWMVMNGVMVVE